VAEFTDQGEGAGIEGTANDGSATDAMAEVHQEEIPLAGGRGDLAESQRTNFLDHFDGKTGHILQYVSEINTFGPMDVRRKQDAGLGFIDNSRDAEEDPPAAIGGQRREAVAVAAPRFGKDFFESASDGNFPFGSGTGGFHFHIPRTGGIIDRDAQGDKSHARMGDADLDEHEAADAGIEAETLARTAGAGFTAEFSIFKDVFGEEVVDDFAGGHATGANDLGQFTACGGRDLNHVAQDQAAVDFAETGGDGGGFHGHFLVRFGGRVKISPGNLESETGRRKRREQGAPMAALGAIECGRR
jgi:hypothetical protein